MKCPPTSLGAPCETLWQLISWLKIRARAVLCPAQSCLTLCDPWTSVHGILQARILEWVAMPSSRASSRPRSPAVLADSLPFGLPGKLCVYIELIHLAVQQKLTQHSRPTILQYAEGNGNPLHSSCRGNSTDRGAWWPAVRGVAESQTRLSDFHRHTYTPVKKKIFKEH